MHGASGGGPGKRARIEIIPLIDIIFFLLATFIMVSLAMSKNMGLHVALPAGGMSASNTPLKDKDKPVTLCVNHKGEITWNTEKARITMGQVGSRLQTYKSGAKDPKVTVCGEGEATNQQVMTLLDQVYLAGIHKVILGPSR